MKETTENPPAAEIVKSGEKTEQEIQLGKELETEKASHAAAVNKLDTAGNRIAELEAENQELKTPPAPVPPKVETPPKPEPTPEPKPATPPPAKKSEGWGFFN